MIFKCFCQITWNLKLGIVFNYLKLFLNLVTGHSHVHIILHFLGQLLESKKHIYGFILFKKINFNFKNFSEIS
jgi:hypothetical protein